MNFVKFRRTPFLKKQLRATGYGYVQKNSGELAKGDLHKHAKIKVFNVTDTELVLGHVSLYFTDQTSKPVSREQLDS